MNISEEQKQNIKKFIQLNNIKELEKYLESEQISLEEFNDTENSDINRIDPVINEQELGNQYFRNKLPLIPIEYQLPLETLNYVLNKFNIKSLNYTFFGNDLFINSPLYYAIINNRFDIADAIIKSRKADINFSATNIIENYCLYNKINKYHLSYILNKGLNINSIVNSHLIYDLISISENELLETIFHHYIFNIDFILMCLKFYKNKLPLSNHQLQYTIFKEKNKIPIKNQMYKLVNDKQNYQGFKILFKHDNSDYDSLIYKINVYELLDKAVEWNDTNFVEILLKYKPFNFKSFNSKKILTMANYHDNTKLLKLLIRSSLLEQYKSYEKHLKLIKKYQRQQQQQQQQHQQYQKYQYNYKYESYYNLILNFTIRIENMELIKYLLESDEILSISSQIDLNQQDVNGEYPIITAIYSDNLEIFDYLLSLGVNCNVKNSNGSSLLSLAIYKNKYDFIKSILKSSSSSLSPLSSLPSSPKSSSLTSLTSSTTLKLPSSSSSSLDSSSSSSSSTSTFISLSSQLNNANENNNDNIDSIKHQFHQDNNRMININDKDASGNYPLMKAISQNAIDIVMLLIEYGKKHDIDMNLINDNGDTPLTLAYRLNYQNIFRYLLCYLDINQKDSQGNNVLFYAIEFEDIETINYLISNKIDVNSKNNSNISCLDYAIDKGVKIFNIFLKNSHDNIQFNIPNAKGEIPLITVLRAKQFTAEEKEDIVNCLLEKGSNVNFIDSCGNSPLIYAIKKRSLPIVKLLIRNGANFNYLNENTHKTILKYAMELGCIEIVNYLMGRNGDINKNGFSKELNRHTIDMDISESHTNIHDNHEDDFDFGLIEYFMS